MSQKSPILVVDDEAIVCESCARILGREGFNVDANTNPVEGLKLAQSGQYSAILLDLKMPQMDGLEFLGQLRKTNSEIPVIIITGYPSQDTANASSGLGVSDYIPKPFTPNEVTDSVKRVLTTRKAKAATAPAAAPKADIRAWEAAGESYRFFDEAWFILGEDATVRAGAVLPRLGEAPASSVLPAVGDKVFRGLPMASLRMKDGTERTIPSPVTGKILEVNEGFARSPAFAGKEPASAAWVVRIAPSDLNADLLYSKTRNVVLACADAAKAARQGEVLAGLGCRVYPANGIEATLQAVGAHESAVLLLDAGSFGRSGPDAVRQVNMAFPKVRVVVEADGEPTLEAAYRANRIFFYALRPFEDMEILDVLHNAFRAPDRPAFAEETESKFLPKWVSRIHITNRKGSKVTLLSFGETLLYHKGLGRQLIGKILDQAYPIETTRGKEACRAGDSFGQAKIRGELAGCDRLVVLTAEDSGRTSGRLTAKSAKEVFGGFSPEEVKKITIFSVETRSPSAPLSFEARTTDALAEHVFGEMVSR